MLSTTCDVSHRGIIDGNGRRIGRGEKCPGRDIFLGPIMKAGYRPQRHGGRQRIAKLAGRGDFQSNQLPRTKPRCTLIDPCLESRESRAGKVERCVAAMFHFPRRLTQQQAPFGVHQIDTTALELMHDRFEVARRIGPKQRKFQAATTRRGTMTSTRITTSSRQNRHDLRVKIDRLIRQLGGHQQAKPCGVEHGSRLCSVLFPNNSKEPV